MAKLQLVTGTTSYIAQVFIQDSTSTTGSGKSGLAFNTSSLTAYYHRDTDTTATAITLATMTVGTFTSSGFKEIDATNMPGWYQFCPPNAALAAGAKSVGFHLQGATGMAPLPLEIELTAVNNQDATKFGMTRVVANADQLAGQTITAAAGVTFPTSVASPTNITAGTITTTTNLTNAPTAGDFTATMKTSIGTAVAASAVASVTGNVGGNVTGSVGSVVGAVGSVTGAVGSVTGNVGGNVVGSVGSVVGAVASVTGNVGGNVTGSVGSVVGAVGSVTGNVGGNVTGTVASVVDISTTTLAESSAVPAATATPLVKLNFMATLSRNKLLQTATTSTLRNDGDAGSIGTSTVSDDGTTFTRNKWS